MTHSNFHIQRKPTRWRIGVVRNSPRTYNPNHAEKVLVRELIAEQFGARELIEIPVRLRVAFLIKMPKSWSRRKRDVCRGKPLAVDPDLDNLEKFFNDCLTKTVLVDDNLICETHKVKVWADDEGTLARIEEMEMTSIDVRAFLGVTSGELPHYSQGAGFAAGVDLAL